MIDPAQLADVISLYTKHGWVLRRVLLSADSVRAAEAAGIDLKDAEVRESSLEGLWFSRRSTPGFEAWELRRLAGSPFALVELVSDSTTEGDRENILAATESRMAETLTSGNGRGL